MLFVGSGIDVADCDDIGIWIGQPFAKMDAPPTIDTDHGHADFLTRAGRPSGRFRSGTRQRTHASQCNSSQRERIFHEIATGYRHGKRLRGGGHSTTAPRHSTRQLFFETQIHYEKSERMLKSIIEEDHASIHKRTQSSLIHQ